MKKEEKEKYDEALTKAAKVYNGANDYVKEIISDIFPIEEILDKLLSK